MENNWGPSSYSSAPVEGKKKREKAEQPSPSSSFSFSSSSSVLDEQISEPGKDAASHRTSPHEAEGDEGDRKKGEVESKFVGEQQSDFNSGPSSCSPKDKMVTEERTGKEKEEKNPSGIVTASGTHSSSTSPPPHLLTSTRKMERHRSGSTLPTLQKTNVKRETRGVVSPSSQIPSSMGSLSRQEWGPSSSYSKLTRLLSSSSSASSSSSSCSGTSTAPTSTLLGLSLSETYANSIRVHYYPETLRHPPGCTIRYPHPSYGGTREIHKNHEESKKEENDECIATMGAPSWRYSSSSFTASKGMMEARFFSELQGQLRQLHYPSMLVLLLELLTRWSVEKLRMMVGTPRTRRVLNQLEAGTGKEGENIFSSLDKASTTVEEMDEVVASNRVLELAVMCLFKLPDLYTLEPEVEQWVNGTEEQKKEVEGGGVGVGDEDLPSSTTILPSPASASMWNGGVPPVLSPKELYAPLFHLSARLSAPEEEWRRDARAESTSSLPFLPHPTALHRTAVPNQQYHHSRSHSSTGSKERGEEPGENLEKYYRMGHCTGNTGVGSSTPSPAAAVASMRDKGNHPVGVVRAILIVLLSWLEHRASFFNVFSSARLLQLLAQQPYIASTPLLETLVDNIMVQLPPPPLLTPEQEERVPIPSTETLDHPSLANASKVHPQDHTLVLPCSSSAPSWVSSSLPLPSSTRADEKYHKKAFPSHPKEGERLQPLSLFSLREGEHPGHFPSQAVASVNTNSSNSSERESILCATSTASSPAHSTDATSQRECSGQLPQDLAKKEEEDAETDSFSHPALYSMLLDAMLRYQQCEGQVQTALMAWRRAHGGGVEEGGSHHAHTARGGPLSGEDLAASWKDSSFSCAVVLPWSQEVLESVAAQEIPPPSLPPATSTTEKEKGTIGGSVGGVNDDDGGDRGRSQICRRVGSLPSPAPITPGEGATAITATKAVVNETSSPKLVVHRYRSVEEKRREERQRRNAEGQMGRGEKEGKGVTSSSASSGDLQSLTPFFRSPILLPALYDGVLRQLYEKVALYSTNTSRQDPEQQLQSSFPSDVTTPLVLSRASSCHGESGVRRQRAERSLPSPSASSPSSSSSAQQKGFHIRDMSPMNFFFLLRSLAHLKYYRAETIRTIRDVLLPELPSYLQLHPDHYLVVLLLLGRRENVVASREVWQVVLSMMYKLFSEAEERRLIKREVSEKEEEIEWAREREGEKPKKEEKREKEYLPLANRGDEKAFEILENRGKAISPDPPSVSSALHSRGKEGDGEDTEMHSDTRRHPFTQEEKISSFFLFASPTTMPAATVVSPAVDELLDDVVKEEEGAMGGRYPHRREAVSDLLGADPLVLSSSSGRTLKKTDEGENGVGEERKEEKNKDKDVLLNTKSRSYSTFPSSSAAAATVPPGLLSVHLTGAVFASMVHLHELVVPPSAIDELLALYPSYRKGNEQVDGVLPPSSPPSFSSHWLFPLVESLKKTFWAVMDDIHHSLPHHLGVVGMGPWRVRGWRGGENDQPHEKEGDHQDTMHARQHRSSNNTSTRAAGLTPLCYQDYHPTSYTLGQREKKGANGHRLFSSFSSSSPLLLFLLCHYHFLHLTPLQARRKEGDAKEGKGKSPSSSGVSPLSIDPQTRPHPHSTATRSEGSQEEKEEILSLLSTLTLWEDNEFMDRAAQLGTAVQQLLFRILSTGEKLLPFSLIRPRSSVRVEKERKVGAAPEYGNEEAGDDGGHLPKSHPSSSASGGAAIRTPSYPTSGTPHIPLEEEAVEEENDNISSCWFQHPLVLELVVLWTQLLPFIHLPSRVIALPKTLSNRHHAVSNIPGHGHPTDRPGGGDGGTSSNKSSFSSLTFLRFRCTPATRSQILLIQEQLLRYGLLEAHSFPPSPSTSSFPHHQRKGRKKVVYADASWTFYVIPPAWWSRTPSMKEYCMAYEENIRDTLSGTYFDAPSLSTSQGRKKALGEKRMMHTPCNEKDGRQWEREPFYLFSRVLQSILQQDG